VIDITRWRLFEWEGRTDNRATEVFEVPPNGFVERLLEVKGRGAGTDRTKAARNDLTVLFALSSSSCFFSFWQKRMVERRRAF
jgi:hypothetical protein